MTIDDLFRLMNRLLPRSKLPLWSAQTVPGRIHIVVFVHIVEGPTPELYAMPRRKTALDMMKAELHEDLPWEVVEDAPNHLAFYQLVKTNARRAANTTKKELPVRMHIEEDCPLHVHFI